MGKRIGEGRGAGFFFADGGPAVAAKLALLEEGGLAPGQKMNGSCGSGEDDPFAPGNNFIRDILQSGPRPIAIFFFSRI